MPGIAASGSPDRPGFIVTPRNNSLVVDAGIGRRSHPQATRKENALDLSAQGAFPAALPQNCHTTCDCIPYRSGCKRDLGNLSGLPGYFGNP